MTHYLVSIDSLDDASGCRGSFSESDIRRLHSPRRGRCFDLENFKAYIDREGYISLATKPDYFVLTTLLYTHLWTRLVAARR